MNKSRSDLVCSDTLVLTCSDSPVLPEGQPEHPSLGMRSSSGLHRRARRCHKDILVEHEVLAHVLAIQ